MKNVFAALWANKHTRYAALTYLFCKTGLEIFEVWFQIYSQQIRATIHIIEGVAVTYGLAAAGAGNVPLAQTGDDLALKKAQKEFDGSKE